MKSEIIEKLLLKNISEDKFFDLCNFIEEVYLMEYDVLVLMARKFFNLFCVFQDINCRRYRRLNIPYENKGKIVTNRALPLIKNDIQNNKFKKIVVADDIIIHGRSIREVYDDVTALCPEVEVLLVSYVRNDKEMSAYEDIVDKISSRYLLDVHEWRELSDEIINIFYMSGRPYISYLPYFSLEIKWENLKGRLHRDDCISIHSADMLKYEIEAFMYTGKELDVFRNLKCCQICAVRFYHYPQINEVIAIPYFCMHILADKSVNNISDMIRNKYFVEEYLDLVRRNNGADEMRIIELEYAFSTWMCMYLFNLLEISIKEWHREIEEYTFCGRFLPDSVLSNQEIEQCLREVYDLGDQLVIEKPVIGNDTQLLLDKCRELEHLYKKNFCKWNQMRQWVDGRKDYLQRLIDNYLAVNGLLDEERCLRQNITKKRLFGMPVASILEYLADFLYDLDNGQREKESYVRQVFATILTSIDSGRGAIINKVPPRESVDGYIESVIYAGEQNYKFYDNTNFPIMYGLYIIEQETSQQNNPKITDICKKAMVDQFADYLEKEQIFYIKEELLQISNWDISGNFGRFLQNSYNAYYGNPVLGKAVNMATDICSAANR